MRYRITPRAELDLEEIALYSEDTWGEERARRYAADLERCFQSLSASRRAKTPLPEMPHIQSIRCQHHFVIYINESTPIVIAILHERTNWITNLRKRLGGK